MKKNNKFRNNNSNYNSSYSLNYKFDSNSIAGKISGTALDLIKKYNELAKDAQQDSDYVRAETFRQYAEHYRKIVTDFNEKRNQNNNRKDQAKTEPETDNSSASNDNQDAEVPAVKSNQQHKIIEQSAVAKKEFKVVEISQEENSPADIAETTQKPKRNYRKKAVAAE